MNKNLLTPYHCAQHLSSGLVDQSCLALIDDEHIWDMNRPLEHDCKLKFLHFMEENSFKSNYNVELCSFSPPQFQYGSFAYDVKLNLDIAQSVAEEMFAYDRFKLAQIPHMLRLMSPLDTQTSLSVYRMGDCHFDITRRPLISKTKQKGKFEFSAIHQIDIPSYGETMQCVQALSIPSQLH
ncbi:unnamed protein product [Rotaria sp. Silwood1]|nr:unnamed protein product [Rotaria sp. Silwood1]CAF1681837.1 unnamed protein product [Rotaria sp. Silwood1]